MNSRQRMSTSRTRSALIRGKHYLKPILASGERQSGPDHVSMRHRAVITGIGAVSPNGIGREQFWEATKLGRSGVRRIARFDPAGMQVQIAGEVAGFDETAYVEPKDRPHVSRCVPMGAAAAKEAVADACVEPHRMSRDELRSIGVLVGSGGGSQVFTEREYRLYYSGNEKQCSVYTIPTSTI